MKTLHEAGAASKAELEQAETALSTSQAGVRAADAATGAGAERGASGRRLRVWPPFTLGSW